MTNKEKEMLTKMDTKLDILVEKINGHLSEHFKMRLVIYAFIGTMIVSLVAMY